MISVPENREAQFGSNLSSAVRKRLTDRLGPSWTTCHSPSTTPTDNLSVTSQDDDNDDEEEGLGEGSRRPFLEAVGPTEVVSVFGGGNSQESSSGTQPTTSQIKKSVMQDQTKVDLVSVPPRIHLSSLGGESQSDGSTKELERESSVLTNRSSTFDRDQHEPVDPTLIDPDAMFCSLQSHTPAAEALEANAKVDTSSVSAARIKKRPKLKNLTRDVKREQRRRRAHIKGKVIDGKHEQYALSIGMMLGIRVAVGRPHASVNEDKDENDETHLGVKGNGPSLSEELAAEEFMKVEKYMFPPEGNSIPPHITPQHKLSHTFKFKAYAPDVFSKIRAIAGVDKAHFMLSVCGSYNYIEFMSNAKSGQFFFYSHDGRYMIKTQTAGESKFLRRILPRYFQYISHNPHNFLTHFYGMYRVKMKHLRRNVHFVIMKSVFNTNKTIHKIWDLKGSTKGRRAKPGESVHKDMDILDEGRRLTVGPKKKRIILEQLERDVALLAELNIMDYSLLLGSHDREKERKSQQANWKEGRRAAENAKQVAKDTLGCGSSQGSSCRSLTPLRKQALHEQIENLSDLSSCSSEDSSNCSSLTLKLPQFKQQSADGGNLCSLLETCNSDDESSVGMEDHALAEIGIFDDDHYDEESKNPMTTRKDLGIESLTSDTETMLSKEIYFFGVIDILQQYNSKKKAETFVKRSHMNHSEISCVDPKMYAKRFVNFCSSIIE